MNEVYGGHVNDAVSLTESRIETRELVTAALIAALLAASVLVTIPLGAVPLTLQVFVVVLAALVLRPGVAAAAVGAYLLLGLIGLPVFSGMQGGPGVLFGPTGGFLVGFLVGAVLGAYTRKALVNTHPLVSDAAAATVCIAAIYVFGWLQLDIVADLGAWGAFVAGVAPFVLIDAAKAVVAVAIAGVLRRSGVLAASR